MGRKGWGGWWCGGGWAQQPTQAAELFAHAVVTETATVGLDHSRSRGGRWGQFDTPMPPY